MLSLSFFSTISNTLVQTPSGLWQVEAGTGVSLVRGSDCECDIRITSGLIDEPWLEWDGEPWVLEDIAVTLPPTVGGGRPRTEDP